LIIFKKNILRDLAWLLQSNQQRLMGNGFNESFDREYVYQDCRKFAVQPCGFF
jgi:hypothetical protein